MEDRHADYVSQGLDLLEFPCRYEIKAMGRSGALFEKRVHDIVGRHLGGVPIVHTVARESSGGRYLSVTCTIEAISREQLDSIYLDLHSEVDILVTL
tara:strand:- start:700 stop:990 length:291 start_codon:yes stop_codon:yes gene_type:complete